MQWQPQLSTPLPQKLLYSVLGIFCIYWAFDSTFNESHLEKEDVKTKWSKTVISAQRPNAQCYPSRSFRVVEIDQASKVLTFQSYYGGHQKTMGGDEFYVTIVRRVNDTDSVSAVGYVSDLNDGRYNVIFRNIHNDDDGEEDWNPFYTVTEGNSANSYSLKLILEYSCGEGALPPPAKAFRIDAGGSINRRMPVGFSSELEPPWLVPVEAAEGAPSSSSSSPQKPQIDLKNFDRVLAVGDSLMQQLVMAGQHRDDISPPWGYSKIQASLTPKNFYTFTNEISMACKAPAALPQDKFQRIILGKASDGLALPDEQTCHTNKTLLLLNSGMWDMLDPCPDCTEYDVDFEDYIGTLRKLLLWIKDRYPEVTIGWKSMTAVHIHQVDCDGMTNKACMDRVKYLSSSRAEAIYQTQLKLLAEEFPEVLVANLYNVTYERAHQIRPGDGRHYWCELERTNLPPICYLAYLYETECLPELSGANVCGDMWKEAFGDSGWA